MGLTSKRPTQTNPENQTKLEEVIGSQVAQSRVNFMLTEERYMKLKLYAAHNRKSMTEVISTLIDSLDER
ncbi:hypothetical protein E6P72_11275 [Moraxella osloensis]|jgi:hypothetical protein|nr:hypothetical protein [Moraxella osloensis]